MGDIQEDDDLSVESRKQSAQPPTRPKTPEFVSHEYDIDGNKRKVALIINNKFDDEILRKRKGTDVDRDNMKKLFLQLRFREEDIITVNDYDPNYSMETKLKEVSSPEFIEGTACLVVVILSYGNEGSVDMLNQHEPMEVMKIIEYFKPDKCPSLTGKPKLFFIQTCPRLDVHSSCGIGDKDEIVIERKIPTEGDILLVHSCIPGQLTWQTDSNQGSLFITTLCEVMMRHWNSLDVQTIMTRMLKQVTQKLKLHKVTLNLPQVSTTLWRELKFK